MQEPILHHNGNFDVRKLANGFCVFRNGITHAILDCDTIYSHVDVAIARCNYLASKDKSHITMKDAFFSI